MNEPFAERLMLYPYRYVIAHVLLIGLVLFVSLIWLGDALGGVSREEAVYGLSADSLRDIWENPLFAPHKFLTWLSLEALGHSALALRLPSVIFGYAVVALFYFNVHAWHRPRVAVIGALLFSLSSWFLHLQRTGEPLISLSLGALILLSLYTVTSRRTTLGGFWTIIATALAGLYALFTPLLLIPYLVMLFFVRRDISLQSRKAKVALGISAAVLLVAAVPIALAATEEPSRLAVLIGIPTSLASLEDVPSRLVGSFGDIFWGSRPEPRWHLGRLPFLDIFTATMAALGLYHYEQHRHERRIRFIILLAALALLVTALSPFYTMSALLLPLVYLFAATGIVTLLTQWYQIFPRNPVARAAALLPMALVMLVSGIYNYQRYFVAWHGAAETQRAYPADSAALGRYMEDGKPDLVIAPDEESAQRLRFITDGHDNPPAVSVPDPVRIHSMAQGAIIAISGDTELEPAVLALLERTPGRIVTPSGTDAVAFTLYHRATDEKLVQ